MLTERERYVLESIMKRWDLALPGDISYSDVTELCERLNVPEPLHMRQMLSQYEPL